MGNSRNRTKGEFEKNTGLSTVGNKLYSRI